MTKLTDRFGRVFPYLRLSITQSCNFRCEYCLPKGYTCANENFLSKEEIGRVARAFADLGVEKIRLTGGEPTIRKDFTEVAAIVANTSGIKTLAFTTNGYRLKKCAQEWLDAGLREINVSVDSLNKETFHKITGHNRLHEVLNGIEEAANVGFSSIKINVVLLKGINDNELDAYLDWTRKANISIRFIELMQTGDNLIYFKKHHLSAEVIRKRLLAEGWVQKIRRLGVGPALELTHRDYKGSIGLIAPYSKDFCKGCNRLRVTSTGDLRLCLFGSSGVPMRQYLQEDSQNDQLKRLIERQLLFKESAHFLQIGDTGMTSHLASIGG